MEHPQIASVARCNSENWGSKYEIEILNYGRWTPTWNPGGKGGSPNKVPTFSNQLSLHVERNMFRPKSTIPDTRFLNSHESHKSSQDARTVVTTSCDRHLDVPFLPSSCGSLQCKNCSEKAQKISKTRMSFELGISCFHPDTRGFKKGALMSEDLSHFVHRKTQGTIVLRMTDVYMIWLKMLIY